jgi:PAS domain-containing protein
VEFLTRVKQGYPEVIRIILSGYTELESITEAINKGHIYKFLLKPWEDQNIKLEIRQALQQYDLIKDNKRLHQQVLHQNEELTRINQNLEEMIVARTRELELKNQALELSHAILEDVPIPIIGVSAEGTIAFINRRTQQLAASGVCIRLGFLMSDLFPIQVSHVVELVIAGNASRRIDGVMLGNAAYDLEIHPLSGRFNRMGAILTLQPAPPSPAV